MYPTFFFLFFFTYYYYISLHGSGEMALYLVAVIALPEDLGLVPAPT